MWDFVFATEDIEEEDADENDQRPRNQKLDLRPVEKDRNDFLQLDFHDDEDEGTESECSHADGFESSGGDAPSVPAEVVSESPKEEQRYVEHHEAYAQRSEIGVAHQTAIYTKTQEKVLNNSRSTLIN